MSFPRLPPRLPVGHNQRYQLQHFAEAHFVGKHATIPDRWGGVLARTIDFVDITEFVTRPDIEYLELMAYLDDPYFGVLACYTC